MKTKRAASTSKVAEGTSTPKTSAGKTAGKNGSHVQRENIPWEINIPDHEPRSDSPSYVVARKVMNAVVKEVKEFFLGTQTPYQDHHGGGLWVKDHDGWLLVKNLAGMEWSQQFCADPQKVDKLRQFAQRIYSAFPESLPAFKLMGFTDVENVLNEPITSPAQISRWCDSIFNASVPLAQPRHTGVVKPGGKGGTPQLEGGVHHYPTPITDIQLFKRDDFQLWVLDEEKQPAAVVPVDHRGSSNSNLRVAYATPGSALHKKLVAAQSKNQYLQVGGEHPMAKQAFAVQNAEDAKKGQPS
ncbi:MAG TPA: DUF6424 family protein [Terriglobia bacterium]